MTPDELRALRVEMAALCGWRVHHNTHPYTVPNVCVAGEPASHLFGPDMFGSACHFKDGHVPLAAFINATDENYNQVIPDYPGDWGAAGQVVEAMRARGYSFSLQSPGSHDTGDGHYTFTRWQASFWGASVFEEYTNPPGPEAAPLAICLAARTALKQQ